MITLPSLEMEKDSVKAQSLSTNRSNKVLPLETWNAEEKTRAPHPFDKRRAEDGRIKAGKYITSFLQKKKTQASRQTSKGAPQHLSSP